MIFMHARLKCLNDSLVLTYCHDAESRQDMQAELISNQSISTCANGWSETIIDTENLSTYEKDFLFEALVWKKLASDSVVRLIVAPMLWAPAVSKHHLTVSTLKLESGDKDASITKKEK